MRASRLSSSRYDDFGDPIYESSGVIKFSVIKLKSECSQTSIRADKSGSKSRADEVIQDGRILVDPKSEFSMGDIFIISNQKWKVSSITPKYDMVGLLDHFQVDLSAWV